jgi:hypothetical protein
VRISPKVNNRGSRKTHGVSLFGYGNVLLALTALWACSSDPHAGHEGEPSDEAVATGASALSAPVTPLVAAAAKSVLDVGSTSFFQVTPPGPRHALDGHQGPMTRQQLVMGGYPLQPDAASEPAKYARWLDVVSKEATVAPAALSVSPDHKGTTSSNNWSGYYIDKTPAPPYTIVDGQWNVPTPIKNGESLSTYSSTWVGMDGVSPLTDLVQVGTEQDFYLQNSSPTYFAWYEFLPFDPNQIMISSVPVTGGQHVLAECFLADANGTVDVNGTYAYFLFDNVTTNVSSGWIVQSNVGGAFQGKVAEWITERTALVLFGQPFLPWLADYGTAQIVGAAADHTNQFHDLQSDPSVQVWMYNSNGDLLSTATTPDNVDTVNFTWQHFI